MLRPILTVIVLGLSALQLAGCTGVQIGDDAPGLAEDSGISLPQLEKYKGKFVFLDFFGVWCGPCIKAAPNVQTLHDLYAGDENVEVVFVHLDLPGKDHDVQGFMDENGYTVPVIEHGRLIGEAFGVKSLPTFVLVSPDGEVLCKRHKFTDIEIERVTKLIAEEREKE